CGVHEVTRGHDALGRPRLLDSSNAVHAKAFERDAVFEAHAETCGSFDVAAQDFEWTHEAVRRAVDAARGPSRLDRGVEFTYLLDAYGTRFRQSALALHLLRSVERLKL